MIQDNEQGEGASAEADRATAAEPVVSALRDGIPSAWPDGVTSTIAVEDVLWEYEGEVEFEDGPGLAILLANEVLFYNRKFLVNCNDVFAWGCADCEVMEWAELEDVFRMWLADPNWGAALWCMKKRKQMPQGPVAKLIKSVDLAKFQQEHGLRNNHYDGISRVFAQRKYARYCEWERERGREPLPYDRNWWAGWKDYVLANPEWHNEEWIAADEAARLDWRIANGFEEPAQAIEARRADPNGSVHESAVAESDAPKPIHSGEQ